MVKAVLEWIDRDDGVDDFWLVQLISGWVICVGGVGDFWVLSERSRRKSQNIARPPMCDRRHGGVQDDGHLPVTLTFATVRSLRLATPTDRTPVICNRPKT